MLRPQVTATKLRDQRLFEPDQRPAFGNFHLNRECSVGRSCPQANMGLLFLDHMGFAFDRVRAPLMVAQLIRDPILHVYFIGKGLESLALCKIGMKQIVLDIRQAAYRYILQVRSRVRRAIELLLKRADLTGIPGRMFGILRRPCEYQIVQSSSVDRHIRHALEAMQRFNGRSSRSRDEKIEQRAAGPLCGVARVGRANNTVFVSVVILYAHRAECDCYQTLHYTERQRGSLHFRFDDTVAKLAG